MSIYKKYLFQEGPFKTPEFDLESISVSDFPVEDWNSAGGALDFSNVRDNDTFADILFGVDNPEVVNGYLKCELTNSSGTKQAKMWSKRGLNFNEVIQEFNEHKIYKISGKWNEWPKGSGKFSVVIERYVPVYDASAEDLLPLINESRTDLRNELLFYISTLSPSIQELALDVLKDVWEHFVIRPAAKGHHHFQLGGLMQHKVELMRVAHTLLEMDKQKQEETLYYIFNMTNKALWKEKEKQRREGVQSFTAFYEKEEHFLKVIDALLRAEETPLRDVVIFSILVHDIGKLLEYTHHGDSNDKYDLWFPGANIELLSQQFGVSMDNNGARIGHITLGTMFVYKYWLSGKFNSIQSNFWFDVIGCILSHHGRIDWGSTKVPETANEWLVHFCDYVDSKYANEK